MTENFVMTGNHSKKLSFLAALCFHEKINKQTPLFRWFPVSGNPLKFYFYSPLSRLPTTLPTNYPILALF